MIRRFFKRSATIAHRPKFYTLTYLGLAIITGPILQQWRWASIPLILFSGSWYLQFWQFLDRMERHRQLGN